MGLLTCDHCGVYTCDDEDYTTCLMWCGPCIVKDHAMIDGLGFIHDGGRKPHFRWFTAGAKRAIGELPKLWVAQPPVDFLAAGKKMAEEPWVPETKPCSRKYYGLPDCTCGTCPPKRRTINTNPFRYGQ